MLAREAWLCAVTRDRDLRQWATLAVAVQLARYVDARAAGEAFPALSTIARDAGLHRRAIQRALRQLERAGYVRARPRRDAAGDPASTAYVLVFPSSCGEGVAVVEPRGSGLPLATPGAGGSGRGAALSGSGSGSCRKREKRSGSGSGVLRASRALPLAARNAHVRGDVRHVATVMQTTLDALLDAAAGGR